MQKIILTGNPFKLHGNSYALNGGTSWVLPLAVAKLNWAMPTSPEIFFLIRSAFNLKKKKNFDLIIVHIRWGSETS